METLPSTENHRTSFLVQRHVCMDGSSGAWISLKIFEAHEAAQEYLTKLNLGENGRVFEAVCEATA